MREMLNQQNKGFTLVELLIVVAIIGILSAIAIPQYSQYKTNAYNSAAQSDIRNGRTAAEAMYSEDGDYNGSTDHLNATLDAFDYSNNVNGTYEGDDGQDYEMCTFHNNGDRIFYTNSTSSKIYYKEVDNPGGTDCGGGSDISIITDNEL